MRTLDEVIFEAPYSPTPWEADALHYLKEYREKHDDILRMEEALGYCEIMDNPPLTWDELKAMQGKPVWIETSCHKYWGLFNGVWDKHGKPHAMFIRGYQHQEKLSQFLFIRGIWQAYRKERK